MSNINITPNMNLPAPIPGVDPGIDYAKNQDSCLTIIDQHNHSAGSGVQITPNGLNINSDLPFSLNNATSLRSTRFAVQSAVLSLPADVGCLYVVGNELYYNDATGGHQVQITVNGSVNAGAGSISGLPSGSASASYSAGTFTWQGATATAAIMDAQSYILRNSTASSKGLTLQAPAAMASNYSLTLPSIPGSLSLMALDASGNMSAPYSISGGLNASVLTPNSITATQIANQTITATQIANSTITGTQIASNVNLPGTAVKAGSSLVVTGNASTTTGLAIIRGTVSASGTILNGEGFTTGAPAPGPIFTITFTTPFASTPVITAVTNSSVFTPVVVVIGNSSTTSFQLNTYNSSSTGFDFIAIGPR